MGNAESAPPENTVDDFDGIETLGYRVLGVQPNSPASAAGLVSFFDFLIGADGQMLLGSGEDLEDGEEYDDVDFPALLEKFKGKTLQLLVWNIKCQEQRLVDIVPSDDWEGAGLLGVTIRLDNYAGAEERLIRVLSVEHNSPAAIAGLVGMEDYLLGTTQNSFDSTKVLAAVLEAHVDKVVELYVYNTNSDKVRVVALMPTWSWGGNGLLGAEVGTGYLHRIPGSCRKTLGGSVERRVRYIVGKGPVTPQQQQSVALELEPQLEMEHDDEEYERENRLQREESLASVSLASQQETADHMPTKEPPLARTESGSDAHRDKPPSKPEPSIREEGKEPPQESDAAPKESETQPAEEPTAENQEEKALPASPAPAPFPMGNAATTPQQPTMSAKDLFSRPPPVSTPSAANGEAQEGEFSTPHPPTQLRQQPEEATEGSPSYAQPPQPPVQSYTTAPAASYTVDMPPPPRMSGANI